MARHCSVMLKIDPRAPGDVSTSCNPTYPLGVIHPVHMKTEYRILAAERVENEGTLALVDLVTGSMYFIGRERSAGDKVRKECIANGMST